MSDEFEYPPGSDEAVDKGCTCPIYDNNHGRGNRFGSYTISADCPLHTEGGNAE